MKVKSYHTKSFQVRIQKGVSPIVFGIDKIIFVLLDINLLLLLMLPIVKLYDRCNKISSLVKNPDIVINNIKIESFKSYLRNYMSLHLRHCQMKLVPLQ